MSDSNQDQDRSPRFTRALLGRILAVGLFVGLGTFAVVQMTMGNKKTESAETTPPAELGSEANQPLVTLSGSNSTSLLSANTNPASQSPAFVSQAKSPSPPPAKSSNSNAFGNSKTGSNAFAAGPPRVAKGGSEFKSATQPPIVKTAKPPTPKTLPTRYAQLPNQGTPIINSNNGFSARPGSNLQNKIPQAIGNTADAAKQIGNNVSNTTSNLLQGARQKADNVAGNLKSAIPNITQPKPQSQFSQQNGFGNNNGSSSSNRANLSLPNLSTRTPASSAPLPQRPFVPSMTAPKPDKFSAQANPQTASDFSNGFNRPPAQNQTPVTAKSSVLSSSSSPSNSGSQFGNDSSNHSTRPQSSVPNFNAAGQSTPNTRQFSDQSRPEPLRSLNQSNLRSNDSNSPSNLQSQSTSPSRNSVPARSVSTSPIPNRATSRIATPATSPLSPRTNNVPGDRELEGVQAPSLTVEKLSPREIQLNQSAEFEIVVRNVGRVSADDVTVYDQIPEGTEFQGALPEPTNLSSDRQISWKIGSLRPGQEKRIKLQLKPTQPGEIGSVAQVTFATKASMRTMVTKPVLEITHRTNPRILIGDDVIFDVIVQNKGDGPAKNVVIQEDVPPQLEYQDGYRELEYDIGTLMPGQSKRVQLGLKAAEIGKLRNVMFAAAEGGLQAKHELDMEVIAPRLTTSSQGPTRRFLQREATHQFGVANQGTAPATNVQLIARLPAGLRFVRADNQGQYDNNTHAVYWKIPELGLDINAAVELVTMPKETGNQDIKFEAAADLNQKSATLQKLGVEHLVDVFFDIDDVVDPIEIGSDTSYRIRVVNQGTKPATNVLLQIDFPSGLVPTSVDGNLQNQIQGQRIAFAPINSMNSGEQLQLLVHAKGQAAGDHRVVVNMQTDGRSTPVSKEETTRVYADQ